MRHLLIFGFLFLSSCATKYILPGNRFITPESQGGAFRGQIEFEQTSANQLKANLENDSISDGVKYSKSPRTGFLISNSLFDQFDIVWSHTGGANSLLGGKFQFLGASRTGNATGHKMSLAALLGGNEHETEDRSVEFELTGKEFLLLYGYRFNENIMPYGSFSYATYTFTGEIKSGDAGINGLEPEYVTTIRSLSGGCEFSVDAFFAKLEATYQQLATDNTKEKERMTIGYALGFSW